MPRNDYKMQISKRAQSELDGIFNYIATELNAPLAAANVLDLIEKKFNDILAFPFLGVEMGNAYTKCRNYRRCIVDHYSIFYKVNGRAIIITAVLHQKQSLGNLPNNKNFKA